MKENQVICVLKFGVIRLRAMGVGEVDRMEKTKKQKKQTEPKGGFEQNCGGVCVVQTELLTEPFVHDVFSDCRAVLGPPPGILPCSGCSGWWKVVFSFPVCRMGMVIFILLSRKQKLVFLYVRMLQWKLPLLWKEFLLNARACVSAGCCALCQRKCLVLVSREEEKGEGDSGRGPEAGAASAGPRCPAARRASPAPRAEQNALLFL